MSFPSPAPQLCAHLHSSATWKCRGVEPLRTSFPQGGRSQWFRALPPSRGANCQRHSVHFTGPVGESAPAMDQPWLRTAAGPGMHPSLPLPHSPWPLTPASWDHIPNKLPAPRALSQTLYRRLQDPLASTPLPYRQGRCVTALGGFTFLWWDQLFWEKAKSLLVRGTCQDPLAS